MATAMWRMNGLCRQMAGLLVLCTLLLSSVVICDQEAATNQPADVATVGISTVNPAADQQNPSVAPGDGGEQLTPGLGAVPTGPANDSIADVTVPAVGGNDAVPAEDAGSSSNVQAQPKSTDSPSSSGSSVFVGILVSGLLAAIGITIGYFYCQRRAGTKGTKLTDEAFPADQENQGSTLASVAPLNPPPETQEKPSVNGESPEAAKTQPPPPNNGHSTTKTADTEL